MLPQEKEPEEALKTDSLSRIQLPEKWSIGVRTISLSIQKKFDRLWNESEDYLKGKETYTADLHVGASAEHYQPVVVENELAWHNVFCQSLLIRPECI